MPQDSVPSLVCPPPTIASSTVLVVEDNPVNQKVVLMMLAKLGCRTTAVCNGLEALDALDQSDYDIVLMDCQMPEMDGFAATVAIRLREAGQKHTQIVALTANAMPGDREKCLASGMDDYISKPVSKNDLQRVIAGTVVIAAGSPDNHSGRPLDEVSEACRVEVTLT